MMTARIYRETRQRNALKQALIEAGRPLGPRDMHRLASMSVPNLGIATVYRNIRVLLEQEEIRMVEVPGRPPVYEINTQEEPPPRFVCTRCLRVFNLEPAQSEPAVRIPEGVSVERSEIIVHGLRAECSDICPHGPVITEEYEDYK